MGQVMTQRFSYETDRMSAGMDGVADLMPDVGGAGHDMVDGFPRSVVDAVTAAVVTEDDLSLIRAEMEAIQRRDHAIDEAGKLEEYRYIIGACSALKFVSKLMEASPSLAIDMRPYEPVIQQSIRCWDSLLGNFNTREFFGLERLERDGKLKDLEFTATTCPPQQ